MYPSFVHRRNWTHSESEAPTIEQGKLKPTALFVREVESGLLCLFARFEKST
jgi:hypothetical protein